LGVDELKFLYKKTLDYGIELSQYQLDLFRIYLDELWHWNRRINLTGMPTKDRMVIELFLDSLMPAPFIPNRGMMLDVGSGAGFPGVPLKIYHPQLMIHLLEPRSKRVSFLKQIIRLLGLKEIQVIKGRIEKDGDSLHPRGYQLITTRGVAGLDQIVIWCAPFLSKGGLLVSFLGSNADEELERSRQVFEKYDVFLNKTIPYSLPGKNSERNVVLFKKMR